MVRIIKVFLYLHNYIDKPSSKSASENHLTKQENCYICAVYTCSTIIRSDTNVKFTVC